MMRGSLVEDRFSPSHSFSELCSPQSVIDGLSAQQHGSADAALEINEGFEGDCAESSGSCASCPLVETGLETTFLELAQQHLSSARTASLIAIWHKETRLILTGRYLKLYSNCSVQVRTFHIAAACPHWLCDKLTF
jgi:hypothetical protein